MTAPHPIAEIVERLVYAAVLFSDPRGDECDPEHAALLNESAAALTSAEALLKRAGEVNAPFAAACRRASKRYEKANSDWFEKMPGTWPITVEVTMDEIRAARALADDLEKRKP